MCSAGNPLNRLSYLRSSASFLSSALDSPKARFLALDNLSPLSRTAKDGVRHLEYLAFADVRDYIGDPKLVFKGIDGKNDADVPQLALVGLEGKKLAKATVGDLTPDEKRHYFLNQVRTHSLSLPPRSRGCRG